MGKEDIRSTTGESDGLSTLFGQPYETTIRDERTMDVKANATGRTPEEAEERASRQYHDYEYYSEPCCYLTTACLNAKGIPLKSSLEFKAIKDITREHILKSFSGKKDYVRYGRVAPKIVDAINSRPDSMEIWDSVYKKIEDVAIHIFAGKPEEGYQAYRDMTLSLKKAYL